MLYTFSKRLAKLLIFTLFACFIASCNKNPRFEEIGNLSYSFRNSQDSIQVQIYSINSPVERIYNNINWLSVAYTGMDVEGNVQILIKRLKDTPSRFVSDSFTIHFSDNLKCVITITADEEIIPSSANNDSIYNAFNKEWWKQEEILYSGTRTINGRKETISDHIPLPWAPYTTSNIPPVIFQEDGMSANEGWMMAYNLFDAEINGNSNSKPYFSLYNRFTGILRTFYYQFDQAGTGGEFSFVVTPDLPRTPKFQYYHSLQYAVPMSNKDAHLKGNVLKITKGENGFQQIITPYIKSDIALKPGWYCFDLDWSAYCPDNSNSFSTYDRISFDCMTANNSQVRLSGVLNGNIDGTTESTEHSSTYSSAGSGFASSLDAGFDAILGLVSGDYLKAAFDGISSIYSLSRTIINNPAYTTETKSTGKINMSFTGNIDLSGYITSNTSNNAIGVEFSPTAFSQSDEAGRGIWSLKDNPVVYVVKDRIFGEDEDFACNVVSDGYSIGAEDPSGNNLRLFTFLDPRSIQFNINTDLFKNIHNVEMSWVLGVYPNQKAGHTDVYRFNLQDFKGKGKFNEPEFIDKAKYNGKVYKSFSSNFANMIYLEYPLTEEATSRIDSSTKPKIYKQAESNYRYYGQAGNNLPETDKNFLLVDPIVLLPTSFDKANENDNYGVGKVYDFKAPDFVVGVILVFKHTLDDGTEATAVFSQRFLPYVVSISANQMNNISTELRSYVNSGVHQKIGDITIKNKDADKLLSRFFSTAKYIKEYDY